MVGAVLLLVGVFMPLVSLPIYGGISLFQIQQPVAIALLVLAAAHLVFCVKRISWGLYLTKLGVLIAIGFGIYRGWDKITGREDLIAKIVRPIVKVHWGTGLLAAGILILMAATIPQRLRRKPPVELPAETPKTPEQ